LPPLSGLKDKTSKNEIMKEVADRAIHSHLPENLTSSPEVIADYCGVVLK
jgi:hypothetical protein